MIERILRLLFGCQHEHTGFPQNERITELENALDVFIHMPQGCTCPNNGGGDCPWCESASIAKTLLEEKL